MGSCVCKIIPLVVKVEEIDVPSLIESPSREGVHQGECISKRKAFIKVKSSRNTPVVQVKWALSSVSTEVQTHAKHNNNSICENSNSTLAMPQESQPNNKKDIGEFCDEMRNIESPCSMKEFTEEEEAALIKVLQKHFLFKNFSQEDIQTIIEEITVYQYDSNSIIFSEGETADKFFIVKKGQIELSTNPIHPSSIKCLKLMDAFGEIALISNDGKNGRTYQAKVIGETEVYGMERQAYLSIAKGKEKDKETIINILQKSYWFQILNEKQRKAIDDMAYIKKYKKNDIVVKESIKDLLFILKGSLVSFDNKKHILSEDQGNCNGLMSILTLEPIKKFTVKAKTDSTLLVVHEKVFIEALGLEYRNEIIRAIISHVLLKDFFLSKMVHGTQIDPTDLAQAFKLKQYKPNQIIFSKGLDTLPKAELILHGEIINPKMDNKSIAREGDLFQSSFLYQSPEFESDYTAKNYLIAFKTTYSCLRSVIFSKGKNPEYFDVVINMLKTFELFQGMGIDTIFSISKHIKASYSLTNSVILNIGDKIEHLYLLAKGTLKVMTADGKSKKKLKLIEEGNSFGEFFLLNERNSPYQYIAKNDVTIYTLPLNSFMEILSEPRVNNYIRRKMCLEESNILFNDLYYLSYLGRGRFGNVCLVHNEVSFYAVKAISKSFSEKQKFGIKYLFSEKRTMNSLDHPFIIKLVKTFKNDNWCFFLQEFISGKNLSEYLELRKAKRNVAETRFYAASLFSLISYIHSKRILHRDIKPANIMINKNGYIKMIDFGTAIKISKSTKTVIGTPNFIAPEVLLGKGYSFPCDYWSIGVCLYYIYYGILPFGNNSLELMDTYKEILEDEVKFPESSNLELKSLLSSLLNKNDQCRYSDLQTIKSHLFFKDFNWDDLMRLKLRPPFIPGKDPREDEENLQNLNSLFVSFIENEKYDTKQLVTLKAGNFKPNTNCNNNNVNEIPIDWSEGF